MMKIYLSALALAACTGRNDPCDGAAPGDACRWAGTGVQGFNREHPIVDRLDSRLNQPTDIVFGPDGRGYIVDWNNHMVRRVEHDQTLTVVMGTLAEGDGAPDMQDRLPVCDAQGWIGTEVALNHPTQADFGPDGLLYVASWHNNKIRTLDPATGIVKTVAGNFYGFAGDGGAACAAVFNQPSALSFAADGTLYTLDQRNVRLRRIATDKTIMTLAGDGKEGNVGDGGPMAAAEFGFDTSNTPEVDGGIAVVDNLVYIADTNNNRVRRINLDTGIIDCIAGNSSARGYSGDGGPATLATFDDPLDMKLGPDGRLYVVDRNNNVVRAIDLGAGIIETVLGNGSSCDVAFDTCPDVAAARDMQLNHPYGLTFDAKGDLYVADTDNNRIIKVLR